MNHLKKMYKAYNKNLLAQNTRFFEYYVRILTLKLGDNLIDMGMGHKIIRKAYFLFK